MKVGFSNIIEFIPFQHDILEKKTLEFFPPPLEYGEKTALSLSRARSSTEDNIWRPKGLLVGHFSDHKAAITVIKVSTDHTFFVTGSEDGINIVGLIRRNN